MSGKPFVFVIDINKKPLMPCTGKKARLLLERKRAKVIRIKPFVIQLLDRMQESCVLQDIEVKIDPGSKYTGICVSRTTYIDSKAVVNALFLAELLHRGRLISQKLQSRAMYRRARRARNTRYRQARFLNRNKPTGWLPPSLMHRVNTTLSWVNRLQRWSPVTMLAVERVKFDLQKLRNPEISGIEYQQGTLFQYDVKEYLLEKWNRKCAYCGIEHQPMEVEHIIPKTRGGSNAISNLTLACVKCNRDKGSLPIEVFMKNKPDVLKRILAQLKKPLKDTTAVNATRNLLFTKLLQSGLPVATGTGSQTKYSRSKIHIPKTHALDAACIGDVVQVNNWNRPHLEIKCIGRGKYGRTALDKYGFPRCISKMGKRVFGFATGDLVSVTIKILGGFKTIIGKLVVRVSGYFTVTSNNTIYQTKWSLCKLLQKADGYSYGIRDYNFLTVQNKLITVGNLKNGED